MTDFIVLIDFCCKSFELMFDLIQQLNGIYTRVDGSVNSHPYWVSEDGQYGIWFFSEDDLKVQYKY